MQASGILAESAAEITARLGPALARIRVRQAVIGLYFTGVALEGGAAGACMTPARPELHATCCPGASDGLLRPGTLRFRPAGELLGQLGAPHPLRRALAIATLNALAEHCWHLAPPPELERLEHMDAFEAAAIAPGEHVVLVGAFVPFLRALKRRGQPYTVLERTPAMLKPEELAHFRPAEAAAEVLPRGDVVLLTGSTLLQDELEPLLAHTRPAARVVVAGPSAGLWPGPYLRRGVDLVGGIAVRDPEAFLEVLAEGGASEQLFGHSVQRVVLRRRGARAAGGVAARAGAAAA